MPDNAGTKFSARLNSWGRELAEVWLGGWRRLRPRLWIILAAVAIGVALVLVAGPADVALQLKCHRSNPDVHALATVLSKHSDLTFTVPFSMALWLIGVVFSRVRMRKLGLACLLATCLAGLITDIFRVSAGRPRPYAAQPYTDIADGFYGPHRAAAYQSFPSGHATTSSATAASVAGAIPVLAIPGAIYAASVSWSRLQLDKHHPIDVTVGTVVGVTCGLSFAGAVPGARIRLKRRKRRRR